MADETRSRKARVVLTADARKDDSLKDVIQPAFFGTSPRRGFTLIEVLVALVILGAVASAAIALISQNTRYVSSAEDRVIASIAADNAMVEALSLALVEIGATEKEVNFAGARWAVTRNIAESGVDGVLRVDVSVRRAGAAQTLARATTLRPVRSERDQGAAPDRSGR